MLITYIVIAWFVIAMIAFVITCTIRKAKLDRENRAFANLPKEVLLLYAQMSPVYSSHYRNLRMVMTEDRAADRVINRMLLDMGLIGYRKVGS